MSKDFFDRWSQFGDGIHQYLKTKISSAFINKQLIDVETRDEGITYMLFFIYKY